MTKDWGGSGKAAKRPLFLACLVLPLALAACFGREAVRPVVVEVIGTTAELTDPVRHSGQYAGQVVLDSTARGLVAFDAQGEVVAALAESWIVADGGQSYIFRLRRAHWANGERIRADVVARLLQQRMRANIDLLAGLRPEVRAMTDRVIEIRLSTAVPAFIQLLAQPRLALLGREGGGGPYIGDVRLKRLYLRPFPPEPDADATEEPPETLPTDLRTVEAARAALALARFQAGRADLVLGGRFQDLLLIPHARLGSTDVRADPAPGLFGMAVVGKSDFLADRDVRDALSRAIDRGQLAKDLNLQGWTTVTTPVPAQLDLEGAPTQPEWSGVPAAERRAAARRAIDGWKAAHGAPPMLRIALPQGAGATLLFYRLAADLGALGLKVDRVSLNEDADLRLIDEVAAFDSALWYLARLDCMAGIACDEAASAHLDEARAAENPLAQAASLAEAERLIVAHGGYIPLGLPIRWSLVSRRLSGYAPSPRAVHPLNLLLPDPN